jgi:uncharacterized protein (DUF4415 family)
MAKAPSKAEHDIPPDLLAQLQHAAAMPDEDIKLDDPDAPELDWSQSGSVRGKFYKPVKKLQSLRIDADVLHHFQAQGPGYQTRINAALRSVMIRDLQGDLAAHHTKPVRHAKRSA